MIKKVIFIALIPDSGLIPFRHKKYFDDLSIKCEYWDLRYLAQHERSNILGPISTPHEDVKIISPKISELDNLINDNKNCVFITGYRITRKNRILYKLFKKHNIRYLVLLNTNTFLTLNNGKIQRKFVRNGNQSYILENSLRKIQRLYNKLAIDIQRPWLSVFGSVNDQLVSTFPEPKNGITYIHNHNYEKLSHYINKNKEEEYIVFIDQYLPWHSETQKFNKWKMNAELYYGKITAFLLKISEETKKIPIIATHPKAEKGKIEKYAGEIKVVYGETVDMIQKSKICILHYSSAVDLVVLLKKEMVITICDELLNSPAEVATRLLCREFQKPILTIEEYLASPQNEITTYSKIDEHKYSRYINNNIKPNSDITIPYWQYIAEQINNLY